MLFILIAIAVIAVGLIYKWIQNPVKYFEDLGIEYDTKATPLLGTFKSAVFKQENFFDALETVYKKFNSGIAGVFDFGKPAFLIRSPEVVRQIAIKDFDHFVNRRKFFTDGERSLFGNSLFQIDDQKWKDMRSSLSPAFTGSKMRAMFELIRDIGQETVKHLKETKPTELELKDFLSRYANDVIATTAFGFQINSNKDKDNEFFRMGKETSEIDNLKFFLIAGFPKIAKLLKMDILSEKLNSYYMKLVLQTMKHRKDNNIFRPDMINMVMEMRGMNVQGNESKKPSKHWTDIELVAQCFLFFLAAFDTVSSTLSFIGQELMENPECQDKLREEILEVEEMLEGKPLTYEALASMKYADAVISEGMRKWPAAGLLDRICTKSTVLHDPITGKDVYIKKGDNVQLAAIGIQRDPKYYPNPMKFDPERFNEENKKDVDPNTVLSFGIGPRMCIGNRFALLEMKSLMFHLFKEFKFEQHEKSVVPLLKLDPSSSLLEPKGGFWVKLTQIK